MGAASLLKMLVLSGIVSLSVQKECACSPVPPSAELPVIGVTKVVESIDISGLAMKPKRGLTGSNRFNLPLIQRKDLLDASRAAGGKSLLAKMDLCLAQTIFCSFFGERIQINADANLDGVLVSRCLAGVSDLGSNGVPAILSNGNIRLRNVYVCPKLPLGNESGECHSFLCCIRAVPSGTGRAFGCFQLPIHEFGLPIINVSLAAHEAGLPAKNQALPEQDHKRSYTDNLGDVILLVIGGSLLFYGLFELFAWLSYRNLSSRKHVSPVGLQNAKPNQRTQGHNCQGSSNKP